jgi:hypothetical protein
LGFHARLGLGRSGSSLIWIYGSLLSLLPWQRILLGGFLLVGLFCSHGGTVGLALQCCIGGDALGFRVYQLIDRRFCFFVASNKVGHFIYGLHDQI